MRRLLLDTQVALRWLTGDRLSAAAAEAVAAPENEVRFSIASAWEVAIEQGLGRLRVREDHLRALQDGGIELLPVTPAHIAAVRDLPQHHRDPFDRMLVAQAQVEGLTLVTRDAQLGAYSVVLMEA